MTWRTARSLDVALAEINAHAPNRSKISDGSIGDAAHASRSSDHNPWRQAGGMGIVGARDFTHDPADGCDAGAIARTVAGLLGKHPALGSGAYVIWNWQIISADRLGEGWRTYSGTNGHTQHVHVSVATSAAGFDNTTPWGLFGPAPTKGLTMDQDVKAAFVALSSELGEIRTAIGTLRQVEAQRHQKTIKELRAQGKTDRQILDALAAGD